MRAALVFLFACSKSSPCPTAEELQRAPNTWPVDVREYGIVAEACRADDWPTEVTDCLRAATTSDQQEPCFKKLTADQKKRLEAALDPIVTEHRADERSKVRDRDTELGQQLDKLGLRSLAVRAPACQGYLDAIAGARKAMLYCLAPDMLWIYGLHQQVLKDVKDLIAIDDAAQLAAGCERAATKLAAAPPCNAK